MRVAVTRKRTLGATLYRKCSNNTEEYERIPSTHVALQYASLRMRHGVRQIVPCVRNFARFAPKRAPGEHFTLMLKKSLSCAGGLRRQIKRFSYLLESARVPSKEKKKNPSQPRNKPSAAWCSSPVRSNSPLPRICLVFIHRIIDKEDKGGDFLMVSVRELRRCHCDWSILLALSSSACDVWSRSESVRPPSASLGRDVRGGERERRERERETE